MDANQNFLFKLNIMRKMQIKFICILLAFLVIVLSSCQKDGILEMEEAMLLNNNENCLTIIKEDADWLDVDLADAVNNSDGSWTFTITWSLLPEHDLEEIVKTQGSLLGDIIVDDCVNINTPWKKQPKKNLFLYNEENGLVALNGVKNYTVTFTKKIDAISGEKVELTSNWTTKWKEAKPRWRDPDGIPDSGDEGIYNNEHQIGFAKSVIWEVP